MRYPASEKLEIIRIVEQSHLPAKRTLDQLGIARRTFYRWYDRFLKEEPNGVDKEKPVQIASDPWRTAASFATLPKTKPNCWQ